MNDMEKLKNGISEINENIDNFNEDFADFLISSMVGQEEVEITIRFLKQIHQKLLQIAKENPEKDLFGHYGTYQYLCINPMLKDHILKLDSKDLNIEEEKLFLRISHKNDEILELLKQQLKISEELTKMSKTIAILESDKRQPLELFELRKKYEELRKEGNILRESMQKLYQ